MSDRLDDADWSEDWTHIEDFLGFARDHGLLLALYADLDDKELFEEFDGAIERERFTDRGWAFARMIYEDYVDDYDGDGRHWLAERWEDWKAGRAVSWNHHATARLAELLQPTIATCRLERTSKDIFLWTRSAPGRGRTGFWIVGGPAKAPPMGGVFRIRLAARGLPRDMSTTQLAVPESRLGCWIGKAGRARMAAENARVGAKLPPRDTWPWHGSADVLVVTRGPYEPRHEPWLRWSDDDDLAAWAALLHEWLPGVLDDVDAHFAR